MPGQEFTSPTPSTKKLEELPIRTSEITKSSPPAASANNFHPVPAILFGLVDGLIDPLDQ
jgi:hypothetical protein